MPDNKNDVTKSGYPIGASPYQQAKPRALTKEDHTLKETPINRINGSNEEFFIPKGEHFTRDVNQNLTQNEVALGVSNPNATVERNRYIGTNNEPKKAAVFSGATTHINPHNDETIDKILSNGTYSNYLEDEVYKNSVVKPQISPLQPFTRMGDIQNPYTASEALFNSYNRTKLPIADIEWRKGVRHIFITRPECYLMYSDGNTKGLCDQAANDEDFNSAAIRMPHIIRLLSPRYISGSFPTNIDFPSNWNFLLSNRVQGLSTAATTMTHNENVTKSTEGFTIMPAMHVESRQGSTLELSFKDTKNLEVFETARLWMLYMYKRKKGIFVPPYNGYQKTNGFLTLGIGNEGKSTPMLVSDTAHLYNHPYDRALEYCASLYDIITNEAGTKILYWCKYYGIYPISANPTLNNENNSVITDVTTSVSFKYHYRLENVNKTLVEFNYDAGITDALGKVKSGSISDSIAFLLKDDNERHTDDPTVLQHYVGSAGMFTGSPYIVMETSLQSDPLDRNNNMNERTKIMVPHLRFMSVVNSKLDGAANVGITNSYVRDTNMNTQNIVGYI